MGDDGKGREEQCNQARGKVGGVVTDLQNSIEIDGERPSNRIGTRQGTRLRGPAFAPKYQNPR